MSEQEKSEEYIPFNNLCPKCNSDEIEFGSINIEVDGEQLKQNCECLACGKRFTIWSEMKWEIGKNE